jgi:hypothetical protein
MFLTFGGFMLWLFRARASVEAWGIQGLGWGSGWAIGGWFIPFANLIIPRLVVDATWTGSGAPLGTTTMARRSSTLIAGWWWTFIGANVLGLFGSAVITPVDGMDVFAGFTAILAVLDIVAAALAIVLVRRITRQQVARQTALDAWTSLTLSGR